MEYLEINNLKKKYGDFELNVDFSVQEGEFLSLIGPSGSGKSTVLSLLTGLEEADEGMIVLDGEDITRKSTQERNIGLVFQDYALFSNMNVEKNIQYGMDKKHKSSKEIREQTDLLLEYVDLVGYGKRSVTSLSGGEAQRVKLATELSKRSTGKTIYVLDEPTTGLHTADVARLIDMLSRLVDAGNTVVVIEHNLHLIKTADYIIDLGPTGGSGGGRVIACGTPEEVAECEGSYTGEYLKKIFSGEF